MKPIITIVALIIIPIILAGCLMDALMIVDILVLMR